MKSFCAIILMVVFTLSEVCGVPADDTKTPGLNYQRNPDGSISGSFGFSQAVDQPGAQGAFGASQTFSFGPKGSSFGSSQSASLNGGVPGANNNFGFSQSNSLSQNQGPQGFGSSGANSASSQFSNPLFSSSQAQANAFANQVNLPNNNNNFNYPNNFNNNPFSQSQGDFQRQPYMRFRPGRYGHGRRGPEIEQAS